MLQVFKISGDSLYPFYKNGERVVCRKIFSKTKIHVDDTVVFEKENYGAMIKKVKSVENNAYFVEGTDPYSIDSRNFGTLTKKELKYKVLFKF
jgi:phage repressor protein C with HTH and peptisase S24 domain